MAIKDLILIYEKACGEVVNISKSDVTFSKGVIVECKNHIALFVDN